MENKLFNETNIGGITTKNKFVRSATGEGMCDESGFPTELYYKMYEDLASGDVGLIITGLMEVSSKHVFAHYAHLNTDAHTESYKKITDVVHSYGSKIIPQLVHIGSQIKQDVEELSYGPSSYIDLASKKQTKEMTIDDINDLVTDYANASYRAKLAGFDGVELHGAHGYLFSKFLTPYYNRRDDMYGGSIEGRSRIITETTKAIKAKCGNDFPVFIKYNATDFMDDNLGFTASDAALTAIIFKEAGIDALEISGGISGGEFSCARDKVSEEKDEAYHLDLALNIRGKSNLPVILVGGLKSISVIERIDIEHNLDGYSMCRPFISEPDLVKQWENGRKEKARCVSCNRCFAINPTGCIITRRSK